MIGLGSFTRAHDPRAFAGLVAGDRVCPLNSVPGLESLAVDDLLEVFENWPTVWPLIEAATRRSLPPDATVRLADLTPRLPFRPRQIVCIGANYRRHVIEMMTDHEVGSDAGLSREERHRKAVAIMDHRAVAGQPYAFVKPSSSLLAPGEDLVIPADSAQVDWELELAVVIGRPCHRVARESALDHVAGYAIANDVSARDRLNRRDIPGIGLDFIAGKGAPGFFPLGPFVVPAALVPDPQALHLTLTVNGEVMQDESTADMIFPVATLIEFVSTHMRLLPGDVISTGSPAGNGTRTGRFLQPGDRIQGRIEGLGRQTFACVAERLDAGAALHRPFVAMEA